MILAATGHRPGRPGLAYGEETRLRLTSFAQACLMQEAPEAVVSGLALGWDTAVALAALDLGLPLLVVIPFPNQASRWQNEDIIRWRGIKQRASRVITVGQAFSLDIMQQRNEHMVDLATRMLALWDGKSGGTANCLAYARAKKRPVVNVWEHWREQS